MALPKVELHDLNNWFSNLVDNINYDLEKIEVAVPALNMVLTTIDTAPIQYLKDSLDKMIDGVNKSLSDMESRLKALEAKGVNNNGNI
jgi:flagellar capping protein FliD